MSSSDVVTRFKKPKTAKSKTTKLRKNARTTRQWADEINGSWGKAKDGVFEAGRLLNEAQDAVDHGEWTKLVGDEKARGMLHFGIRTSQMLQYVANCAAFKNENIFAFLPNSWAACYDLARLANKQPDVFDAAMKSGVVSADAHWIDVKHWIKARQRHDKHKAVREAAMMQAHEGRIFNLVYADPPWKFETRGESGQDLTAQQHYDTMPPDEIAGFRYGERPIIDCVAKDAVLMLWATPANRELIRDVITYWGFEYRSEAVWVKDRAGTGFWFRQQHEPLLLCTRGSPPLPVEVFPSVFSYPRREHSAKPPEIRAAIEKMFPHWDEENRLELFPREPAPNWTVYGYEAK